MYSLLGSSSSAFLYSTSARAKSPLASIATARLLWARAFDGSFAIACSKRKAASRQWPSFATSVPKASCVDERSVWEYDVHALATRSRVRTHEPLFLKLSPASRVGVAIIGLASTEDRRIVASGSMNDYLNP